MRTIILTGDARGDRPIGTWLRDLGFLLIEAGCEINISRLDGPAAKELMDNKGMEVVEVRDAFAPTVATQPHRAGARAYPPQQREHEAHMS